MKKKGTVRVNYVLFTSIILHTFIYIYNNIFEYDKNYFPCLFTYSPLHIYCELCVQEQKNTQRSSKILSALCTYKYIQFYNSFPVPVIIWKPDLSKDIVGTYSMFVCVLGAKLSSSWKFDFAIRMLCSWGYYSKLIPAIILNILLIVILYIKTFIFFLLKCLNLNWLFMCGSLK